MIYYKNINVFYNFIPKNTCSTLKTTFTSANGTLLDSSPTIHDNQKLHLLSNNFEELQNNAASIPFEFFMHHPTEIDKNMFTSIKFDDELHNNKVVDKTFSHALQAYSTGKEKAVEKLLNSVQSSTFVRANVYNALAKHLRKRDKKMCLYYAELAYFVDPRPYRLKYYILRLCETDNTTTAQTAAAFLPLDTKMSPNESSILYPLIAKSRDEE